MPQESKSFIMRPFTFDRVVRLLIIVGIVIAAIWLINRLSTVLLPFLVAWLIAYILEPFVQRNRKVLHSQGRFLPVMLTLFEMLALIVVLCVIFLPSIFDEMHQMAVLIKRYAETSTNIPFIPENVHDYLISKIDFKRISDSMTHQDMQSLLDVVAGFLSGGVSVIMGLFDWFLVILYVIFIMLDYERLLVGVKRIVPPRAKHIVFKIFDDVKNSMDHYFRGQALVAFIVGVLFSIGFLIIGLPLAVVLGLFIGLLNMVPYMQLISIPITTMLCLVYSVQDGVEFWPTWWACMLVYAVVQCTQDLFLTPKIMGKAMGMNPALILFSLSVWGSLLGFIGLIIALPLTTLLMAYYDEYIIARYRPVEEPDSRSRRAKTKR